MELTESQEMIRKACVERLDLKNASLSEEYYYDSIVFCLIDAIFSINVKYSGVRKVVINYCKHYGLNRLHPEGSASSDKCAECGAYLIGIADKTHGKEYIRYRCPNHKNNKCSTKDIRAEALNEYVAKLIVYKLFPKNALNKTNEMLAKADMSKELMKKRKITFSAILQLTNNLEKVTSEALSNKLKEREDELKQIEIQIKKLKSLRITDEKAYRKIRSRIVKMLMNPNYDLRCLIANIVEEITIGNETIEVTLKM